MFYVIILLIRPSLTFKFYSLALSLCISSFSKIYKVTQTEKIEFQG